MMFRSGILPAFFVLLSLVYGATAVKVCLLRDKPAAAAAKCLVNAAHIDDSDLSLLVDLCHDGATVEVLTTKGGEIGEQSFLNCGDEESLGVASFAWLTWNDFLTHLKSGGTSGYSYREGNAYLGRNLLQQQQNDSALAQQQQLCSIDLANGQCVSFDREHSQHVIGTEVLVQRLPLAYELRNITDSLWRNVTENADTVLATTRLANHRRSTQFVQKIVPYDDEKRIDFELPDTLLAGVSVLVYDAAGRLGLQFEAAEGGATTLITKSVSVIKRLLARTSIEAVVRGTNTAVLSEINANLRTVYDSADDKRIVDRFTKNITIHKVERGVSQVVTEFGIFVKLDASAGVEEEEDDDFYISSNNSSSSDGAAEGDSATTESYFSEEKVAKLFQASGPVYPGFRTISTIAAVIFFSVLVTAFTDVFRKLTHSYQAKKNGSYDIVFDQHDKAY